MSRIHPTKQILLDTTVALLDELGMEKVTSDLVLERSGISKGSLYHHFPDFGHLVDEAHVIRFSRSVDLSIEVMTVMMRDARTVDEIRQRAKELTRLSGSPDRAAARADRAWLLGMASQRPHLASLLGAEQARLTGAIADIIREIQERGWFRKDVDPVVGAIFIQAYPLGLGLNDISPDKIEMDHWVTFIDGLVESAFFAS